MREEANMGRHNRWLSLIYKRKGMISKKTLLILNVTIVLVILITATLVLLHMRTLGTNRLWESQMYAMAGYAAAGQALDDYEAGTLRLYELAENGERKFSGRYEGPFEIWYWPYYPISGQPGKYTQEVFIEAYNRKMKYMHKNSEDSKLEKTGVSRL